MQQNENSVHQRAADINSDFVATKEVITNVPIAAVVKKEGFTNSDAIAMVLKARAKGPGSKPSVDFPTNSGQTKIVEGTIGGKSGKIKLLLTTFAEEKKDGTFVVTLTKDWNVKVGNKEVISYWEYQVDFKAKVALMKSEDNDKLVATGDE
ncbi:hypothetical protein ACFPPD_15595 [Cohnella suwonensis]|uniref:Uncharacterized protein n=1 Tax=Cohnella suwonensis TaxID=696072 RepID=A0ABW0LYQ5_9BACL